MNYKCLPGAEHILAQPLKRCTASRVKPNETFQLAKKRQTYSVLGCVGVWVCGCVGVRKKEFFYVVAKLQAKSQKPSKSLCPTVLELRWVISTWWDENMTLFVFSACYEIRWNWFCGRKQTKHAKIRKRAFFGEGCFDRKEYISNTANKRCSRQMLQLRCSSWYSIKFYT